MIWLVVTAIPAAILAVPLAVLGMRARAYEGLKFGLPSFVLGAYAVVAAVVVIATAGTVAHDETLCERQAVDLERDTRFVRHATWDWSCLVRTNDGWVGIDKILKFETSD